MFIPLALQLIAWVPDPSTGPMPTGTVETVAETRTCDDPPYGQVTQVEYFGSTINPTGNPIGGGYGYSASGWPGAGDVLVNNVPELTAALAMAWATPGADRIWLSPAGDFDVDPWILGPDGKPSRTTVFKVPDDTTLFSMRGTHVSGGPDGALVRMDTKMDGILFEVGRRVHFYGLRIQGPDTGTDTSDLTWGILQRGVEEEPIQPGGLEVDNCELYGWTRAAVEVSHTSGAHVHHNYIHENQKSGYGYGVAIGNGADARVIANLFDRNRHAISGDGTGTSYEAAWNTVMSMATQHAFDMHGRYDRCDTIQEQQKPECQPGSTAPDAGEWMYIHHNTFLNHNYNLDHNNYAVRIRGVVHQCAWIENNYFAHLNIDDDAVGLDHVDTLSEAHIRAYTSANRLDWNGVQWSAGGRVPWNALAPTPVDLNGGVLFGDFDADGKDDMFRLTSDGHWWFRLTGIPAAGLPADQGWFDMGPRSPGLKLADMAVGDFDGNGAADVFVANGSRWSYYPWGYGAKVDLGAHTERRKDLRFGRFDTDGKTDVFKTAGGRWQYASGGLPGWNLLSPSNVSLGELAFGDFVGDDRTDVFRAAGGVWRVSDAGLGGWAELNHVNLTTSQLRFADLDGDGHTDVFTSIGGVWIVVPRGVGEAMKLGSSDHPLSSLGFADIDGDGASDVIYSGVP